MKMYPCCTKGFGYFLFCTPRDVLMDNDYLSKLLSYFRVSSLEFKLMVKSYQIRHLVNSYNVKMSNLFHKKSRSSLNSDLNFSKALNCMMRTAASDLPIVSAISLLSSSFIYLSITTCW